MKIVVLGATGMAGRAITAEALTRGHRVVAVARQPERLEDDHPHLDFCAADLADGGVPCTLFADADAAVLAVRFGPGSENRIADVTDTVLDAAASADVPVLIIGGSAGLLTPDGSGRLLIDEPAYVPAAFQSIARASLEQLRVCQTHAAARWTYLSPPADFSRGARTGRYRRGGTTLLVDEHGKAAISAADLAIAAVDELEEPGSEAHFTVAAPFTTQPVPRGR